MNYKRSFMIMGLILIIFVFAGLGCKNQKTDDAKQSSTPALLTNDPASYDAEFDAIKAIADNKAFSWNKDAKLVYLSTKIPLNFDPALIQHTFVYDSAKDTYNHWTVAIVVGSKSSLRALIPKVDYLGSDNQQILSSFWKMNFVTALQTCDKEGGSDFRNQRVNDYQIELNLFRLKNQNLTWQCRYSSLDKSENLEIKVSAENGNVVR